MTNPPETHQRFLFVLFEGGGNIILLTSEPIGRTT